MNIDYLLNSGGTGYRTVDAGFVIAASSTPVGNLLNVSVGSNEIGVLKYFGTGAGNFTLGFGSRTYFSGSLTGLNDPSSNGPAPFQGGKGEDIIVQIVGSLPTGTARFYWQILEEDV